VSRWHEYIPGGKQSVNKLGNTHWGDVCQPLLQVLMPSEEGCGMLGFRRISY
jgi:hypothetical protein